jgi:hypothetical protein
MATVTHSMDDHTEDSRFPRNRISSRQYIEHYEDLNN